MYIHFLSPLRIFRPRLFDFPELGLSPELVYKLMYFVVSL
jgi:hypothetical protein